MENNYPGIFDYYAEFNFDENDFREFSAVGYRQLVRTSVYILLLYIGFCIYSVMFQGFLPVNPIFHLAYLFFTVVVFLINRSRMKTTVAKEVSYWDKPYRKYRVSFGENIAVTRDGVQKVYLFSDVKKIFTTDNLYCLFLRQKSYIIIKRPFDARSKLTDFPEYLFSKSKRLRSPRVRDLRKLPKINITVFFITVALILLCLIAVVLPVMILRYTI